MKEQKVYQAILDSLYTFKDDSDSLTEILNFLEELKLLKNSNVTYYNDDHLKDIPQKYRQVIKTIGDNISSNLISYFNPQTLEIEEMPKDMLFDSDFDSEDEDDDEYGLKHHTWEECITIEPLESFESYKIMEDFVEYLPDRKFADILAKAINGRKPFAGFNQQIHQSDYRQNWFDFKQMEAEKYVIRNYFYDIELI